MSLKEHTMQPNDQMPAELAETRKGKVCFDCNILLGDIKNFTAFIYLSVMSLLLCSAEFKTHLDPRLTASIGFSFLTDLI